LRCQGMLSAHKAASWIGNLRGGRCSFDWRGGTAAPAGQGADGGPGENGAGESQEAVPAAQVPCELDQADDASRKGVARRIAMDARGQPASSARWDRSTRPSRSASHKLPSRGARSQSPLGHVPCACTGAAGRVDASVASDSSASRIWRTAGSREAWASAADALPQAASPVRQSWPPPAHRASRASPPPLALRRESAPHRRGGAGAPERARAGGHARSSDYRYNVGKSLQEPRLEKGEGGRAEAAEAPEAAEWGAGEEVEVLAERLRLSQKMVLELEASNAELDKALHVALAMSNSEQVSPLLSTHPSWALLPLPCLDKSTRGDRCPCVHA
jgi:hypothetical protein